MTVTAVAEPKVDQERCDFSRMDTHMDLVHTLLQLEAMIDAVLSAGYLDDLSGRFSEAERALLILNACQERAGRATELSRRCEEIYVGMLSSP